jgi:anti-sigma B factor antagonist
MSMSTSGKPMQPEFGYAFDSLKNAAVVRLRGRAAFDQMPVLEKCFQAVQALTDSQILLELSELAYIGSAGLGALITLKHAIEARGGRIALVAPNPLVSDLFETAGLTKVFAVYPTLEAAAK